MGSEGWYGLEMGEIQRKSLTIQGVLQRSPQPNIWIKGTAAIRHSARFYVPLLPKPQNLFDEPELTKGKTTVLPSNLLLHPSLAIAPRALLAETQRILLSASLEIGLPSGDERRDLGSGELGLVPSIYVWADLGNWFSLGGQLGTVHGVESGDSEFFYNVALGYSFLTQGAKDSVELRHFPSGMSNLIIELTGRAPLEGPDSGRHNAEVLFGAIYNIDGRCGNAS